MQRNGRKLKPFSKVSKLCPKQWFWRSEAMMLVVQGMSDTERRRMEIKQCVMLQDVVTREQIIFIVLHIGLYVWNYSSTDALLFVCAILFFRMLLAFTSPLLIIRVSTPYRITPSTPRRLSTCVQWYFSFWNNFSCSFYRVFHRPSSSCDSVLQIISDPDRIKFSHHSSIRFSFKNLIRECSKLLFNVSLLHTAVFASILQSLSNSS